MQQWVGCNFGLLNYSSNFSSVFCSRTVVALCDCAATVAISHRDTCHCLSPPPLFIAIAPPPCCPFFYCCRHQSPLCCHCATLRHLLVQRHPSMRWLVLMLGWLLSLHLSSRYCLATCRLVVRLPLNAPPSCLPRLVVTSPCHRHRLSMHQLIVTLPFIAPPFCLPQLIVASTLVTTEPLNTLAGCTLPLIVPPSHLTWLVVASPLITAILAHHDCTTILPSIALSLPLPIAIALPS